MVNNLIPKFELSTNGDFFSEKLRPNWDKPRGKNIRLYMNCVQKYSELMFLVNFSIFSSILGAQEVKKQLSNGNYSF